MTLNNSILTLLALSSFFLTGCNDNPPMYGRPEAIGNHHIFFGNSDLEYSTRIEPITAHQDPSGILHVELNIRSTADTDHYVDAFITFRRNGQFVEKLGPKNVVLKGNLPETILLNSTQPADDYSINLDYSK